jgi:YfiH family protein
VSPAILKKNVRKQKPQSRRSPQRKSAAKPQILQASDLSKIPWLVHGFSTRPGGHTTAYGGRSLNLGFTPDDKRETVQKNRSIFLKGLGAAGRSRPWPLVTVRQVHSDLIHIVRSPNPGLLVGDGLVTNVAGVALGIQTADCFPVIAVDTRRQAIGVFHAGWRGTVKRIVEKGLGVMRQEYGSLPADIRAVIGAGIQKCCYAVGDEVKSKFESQFPYADALFHEVYSSDAVREKYPMLFMNARAPGHGPMCSKLHLDLAEANRRQLLAAGVPVNHISVIGHCTSCKAKKFFSHRADKGKTGRMMAVAGVKTGTPVRRKARKPQQP